LFAGQVLSLPIWSEIEQETIERVVQAIKKALSLATERFDSKGVA
jgi:dTDP-4-amino-4,6-dideoxygalactose transaminase